MNEFDNEDFILEETSFKITPEGSSFLNCTPSILGPQYDQILSLNYSQMRLIGIEVVYHWISCEGLNAPCLVLKFRSTGANGDIIFSIHCKLYLLAGDLSSFETKPLPDINPFTHFAEVDCSMEVDQYSNYSPLYQRGVLESTLTLKNRFGECLEIKCFRFQFKFGD